MEPNPTNRRQAGHPVNHLAGGQHGAITALKGSTDLVGRPTQDLTALPLDDAFNAIHAALDGVPGFGLAQQRGKALAADQLGIHHAGVTLLCHGSFHVPFKLPAVSNDSRRPQQAPVITS